MPTTETANDDMSFTYYLTNSEGEAFYTDAFHRCFDTHCYTSGGTARNARWHGLTIIFLSKANSWRASVSTAETRFLAIVADWRLGGGSKKRLCSSYTVQVHILCTGVANASSH